MNTLTFAPMYVAIYPRLVEIANKHGYALAVHGSLQSDMDLIAVPWTEDAGSPQDLMEAFAKYLHVFEGIFGTGVDSSDFGAKPHGRISWSLQTSFGSAIDLSVMPRRIQQNAGSDIGQVDP